MFIFDVTTTMEFVSISIQSAYDKLEICQTSAWNETGFPNSCNNHLLKRQRLTGNHDDVLPLSRLGHSVHITLFLERGAR